jgi:hypothetical protein
MGNQHKGEVSFEALGKTWRLKLGMAAQVELEEEFGFGLPQIAVKLQDPEAKIVTLFASVLMAGLRKYHPDMTRAQMFDLIDDYGQEKAANLLRSMMSAAFPDAETAGEGGAKNPQ